MPKYNIKHIPIDKLKPNPDNPRLIKDDQFKKLVKSLEDCPELFEARPCICSDRTGELIIIGGNMRYRAAVELKYEKVPAIVITGLTEAQEREIAIKDNGNFGQWDFDALANTWGELPLIDWGVDLPDHWQKEPSNDDGGQGDGENMDMKYQIIIECENEKHQTELLKRFEQEEIKCRPLML